VAIMKNFFSILVLSFFAMSVFNADFSEARSSHKHVKKAKQSRGIASAKAKKHKKKPKKKAHKNY
jgi:hypothetical protein